MNFLVYGTRLLKTRLPPYDGWCGAQERVTLCIGSVLLMILEDQDV